MEDCASGDMFKDSYRTSTLCINVLLYINIDTYWPAIYSGQGPGVDLLGKNTWW